MILLNAPLALVPPHKLNALNVLDIFGLLSAMLHSATVVLIWELPLLLLVVVHVLPPITFGIMLPNIATIATMHPKIYAEP